jgi:hypothetical protein
MMTNDRKISVSARDEWANRGIAAEPSLGVQHDR